MVWLLVVCAALARLATSAPAPAPAPAPLWPPRAALHLYAAPAPAPTPGGVPARTYDLQQMLELQRLQLNPLSMLKPAPPLVILLANDELQSNQLAATDAQSKADFGKVDEDLDSVVLTAPAAADETPPRAVVLLPDGRFSIGDFISSIPWLPIEVNVPDTISWAYNGIASGIAGIISIIGQRFPFQRPQPAPELALQPSADSLKSILSSLRLRSNLAKPIMIMPYEAQTLHLPIQV